MSSKKDIQYANDLRKDLIRKIEERVMSDAVPKGPPNIWKPTSYEYETALRNERENFQKNIFNDWDKFRISQNNPDEEFCRQITKDIAEIKDAIRKIGIMFGEDAPSTKMMKKHKMLKDAFNKYKMIEALILGQDR